MPTQPFRPDRVATAEPLLQGLGRIAATAPSLLGFREAILDRLAEHVAFDAAIFHALSPRIPLDTGVVRGIDPRVLAESMATWDDLAVDLGALRDHANAKLVTTLAQAMPSDTAAGRRAHKWLRENFGMGSMLMMHLVVRDAAHAAIVLLARPREAFSRASIDRLLPLAAFIAVADLMHQQLDVVARASTHVHLQCLDNRLTPQQRIIVEHVALGHSNRDIATALSVSPHTVRNHLVRMFARVGASNRADLVRLAVLLPPPAPPT